MEKQKTAVIVSQRKTQEGEIDAELVELCRRMRLMSERDVDATLAQVLKAMMQHARDSPMGGSELSKLSGINRITIIHHLKRLEGVGFVQRQEGRYILRVHSAEDMILEFRKEMEQTFQEMDEMARGIDEQFAAFDKMFEDRMRKRRLP
ncbi:MAG: ArsR family transcriptional regulator [Candidatus Micrarchaeota archaeon]|nr:ArsR family transcriptional regulator [Candidatus Micrarchaeota archaeon]